MDKIFKRFTITEDWIPLPWSVCKVIPLMNEAGEVLAYAEEVERCTKVGLPKEFFNHGMRELDIKSPTDFAEFMSEYGLVGLRYGRCPMTQSVMDVNTIEGALETDRVYKFDRAADDRDGYRRRTGEETLAWYKALQKAAEDAGLGWTPLSQSINFGCDCRMFVTAYEAEQAFTNLLTAADVAIILLQSDVPEKIADMLKLPLNQMYDHVAYWTDYVNLLLSNLCPQMELDVLGSKNKNAFGGEEYQQIEKEGNFDQAVALQIYKFSLAKNQYKICKECGKVFVERDSKGRMSTSRSTAKFCSDKCHNRYSQREKRRRDTEKRRSGTNMVKQ